MVKGDIQIFINVHKAETKSPAIELKWLASAECFFGTA